jgi:hypothetical protein
VTYLGEVSEQEKMVLIKASHLNILMSQLEALGLAQIEFMYLGVPIITSAVGGQAWLIRNEVEGIHVDGPDDIEGAASAITRLVDNSTLWNTLSANAKERATSLTISKLTAELDEAITQELIKERGLTKIPREVRVTLSEPESVLKSWSSGSWGVIATGRRLFIRRGIISRKVTEIPYANILSIEYLRRYAWKTLAIGLVISLVLFAEPFLRSIFSRAFISSFEELVQHLFPEVFWDILPTIPFLIAVIAFAAQARTGFALRGPGIPPLYLPRRFQEVITFIRSVQNGQILKRTDEENHTQIKSEES